MNTENNPWVAVVGAGPAGMFGSFELASQGIDVVLLNRDIKPGGLAEYGIYPTKYRLRGGLRSQFRQILTMRGIEYIGNIRVAQDGDLTLADLRRAGAQAILVCTGAQGTKYLGIPGEDLRGVIHAKELVYHYNHLPPFSETDPPIGRNVVIIGIGNVMVDIARWLLENRRVDSVTAIGRRGPLEAKFDRREIGSVAQFLDLPAIESELAKAEPLVRDLGGDLASMRAMLAGLPGTGSQRPCLRMRFLLSPTRIQGQNGRVSQVVLVRNTLVREGALVLARHGAETEIVQADTIIYAIGDMVEPLFGLPVTGFEFSKNAHPRFPVDETSFEVMDPATGGILPDVFVAGWARQVSRGQVGIAHKDGVNAARALHAYLDSLPDDSSGSGAGMEKLLAAVKKPVVRYPDLLKLEEAERSQARDLGVEEFKFTNNAEMLRRMGL